MRCSQTDTLFEQALVVFTSLLTLFNPAAAIAPFVTHTKMYPRDVQYKIARRVALWSTIAMVLTTWVGRPLLHVLGVSLPALQLTGGFILLLAALPMVTRAKKEPPVPPEEFNHDPSSWTETAAMPLTFPLSIGGATAAAIVTASAGHPGGVTWLGVVTGVCVLMGIVIWITFRFAPVIAHHLGLGGMLLLSTLGGIVLVCIAFQILATALGSIFPEDLRPSLPKA